MGARKQKDINRLTEIGKGHECPRENITFNK
jgi:hypothetical protein